MILKGLSEKKPKITKLRSFEEEKDKLLRFTLKKWFKRQKSKFGVIKP
jgi:hypothetical protein